MARGKRYQPEQVVNLLRQAARLAFEGPDDSRGRTTGDHQDRWDRSGA